MDKDLFIQCLRESSLVNPFLQRVSFAESSPLVFPLHLVDDRDPGLETDPSDNRVASLWPEEGNEGRWGLFFLRNVPGSDEIKTTGYYRVQVAEYLANAIAETSEEISVLLGASYGRISLNLAGFGHVLTRPDSEEEDVVYQFRRVSKADLFAEFQPAPIAAEAVDEEAESTSGRCGNPTW